MYAPGKPRASGVVDLFQRVTVEQPVRLLRKAGLAEGARVLDAGAGPGRLVAALREAGYDATGIEPSQRSVAIAEEAGLPVTRQSLQEHEDAQLDAVVLWHVLEHIDDPLAALSRIRSWLRGGGLLLLGVPNVGSWQAAIAGPGWLHLDAPRHRLHLTPRGLTRLLERAGFETQHVHHLVWEQNPHAMWMSMLTRMGMTPGFPFHLLKRNIEANPKDLALLALGLPLLPLAVAAELVAAGLRRGGTVAAIARETTEQTIDPHFVVDNYRPHGGHEKMLAYVGSGGHVLDAGCATGNLSRRIAERGNTVEGLEIDPKAARQAERWCERVVVADVESDALPYEDASFDVVLAGDLVEHLRDPVPFLERIRPAIRPGGRLVLSTPNVANWSVRLSLLFGRFRYSGAGILARSHIHLFTRKTIVETLERAGYRVDVVDYTVPVPLVGRFAAVEGLAHRVARLRPSLFAFQFVVVASPAK